MSNFPVNIWVYTFCYNNSKILPFIIDYWKLYATKVVVYDNMSTDNSVDILKQYDWIEVRQYDTNNKFDLNLILTIKNLCYKECNADYIMVCDIDEVLLYGNQLMNLILAKKNKGVKVFKAYYVEAISKLFPLYNNNLLLSNSSLKYFYNKDFKKIAMFDPTIFIRFTDFSHDYITNEDTDILPMIHFKMLGLDYLKELQNEYFSRCTNPLFYGNNDLSCLSLFNKKQMECIRSRANIEHLVKILTIQDDSQKVVKHKITWLPATIEYNQQHNFECVVMIPVYKTDLNENEILSIKLVVKVLGEKYDLTLVGPTTLNFDYYEALCNYKFNILKCNSNYFKGLSPYSDLCETPEFYLCFDAYKFMLIYQLDGWIFKDNINKYITLDYDYIGSPWKAGDFGSPVESVGNGGVSFRKISKFIEVCKKITQGDLTNRYVGLEDLFFCKHMKHKTDLQLADIKCAMSFSLDITPDKFVAKMNNLLPMCCHAWHKHMQFWKNYIPENLIEKKQKEDAIKAEEIKKAEEARLIEEKRLAAIKAEEERKLAEAKAAEERRRKEEAIKKELLAKQIREQEEKKRRHEEYVKKVKDDKAKQLAWADELNKKENEKLKIQKQKEEEERAAKEKEAKLLKAKEERRKERLKAIEERRLAKKQRINDSKIDDMDNYYYGFYGSGSKTSNKKSVVYGYPSGPIKKNVPLQKPQEKLLATEQIEQKNKEDNENNKTSIFNYICEGENGMPLISLKYKDEIIITLTSWKKRINNVKTVLESILTNSMLPSKIVINLAIEEFINKEKDIPNDLLTFVNKNNIIEINWVKHNTLVWKKIFPTLYRYPNAKVICIDDDRVYPKNFIETFYNASLKNPNNPLSGAKITFYNKLILHCGHCTLEKFEFYSKHLDFITLDVLDLKSSDSFYTFYANKCGFPIKYVGTDFLHSIKEGEKIKNNDGYSKNEVKLSFSNIFNLLEKKWEAYTPKLSFCIIHYNTPFLTECLIHNLDKFVPNNHIYIFDNSDKLPFTYRNKNITYLNNTDLKIINFNNILDEYPTHINSEGKVNNYGSFKHCISVDTCMQIIRHNFILLDSDILLTRKIDVFLNNENQTKYLTIGGLKPLWNKKMRLAPFICYINTIECDKRNIHYFDGLHMHGLGISKDCDSYDTGCWFYELCKNEFLEINLNDYILHYGGGSWAEISNNRPIVSQIIGLRDKKMTSDEWANINKNLWN